MLVVKYLNLYIKTAGFASTKLGQYIKMAVQHDREVELSFDSASN